MSGRLPTHRHAHRGRRSKTYTAWASMLTRCRNPRCRKYPNYGGRGIKVCVRWLEFGNFLEDMGECPADKDSLGRENGDGNYCPENCRWETWVEQGGNTSRVVWYELDGRRQHQSAWAKELGIGRSTLQSRVARHGVRKALTMSKRVGRYVGRPR